MSIVGLRNAVISSIQSEVSSFQVVQKHGGRFSAQEIRRVATKAPAALVAVLGGSGERQGGIGWADLKVFVFVVTAGTSADVREDSAPALAESVFKLAAENKWAYERAQAPKRMRIDNLYSGAVDKLGIALWSVSWEQHTELGAMTAAEVDALDDMRRVHVDVDLAPLDGVIEDELDIYLRGTLMSAYGQIYVSSSAATAIAAADTYQKAAGTTTLLRADGFDMPATGRLRHTDDVTRPVSVEAAMSVSVDADAKVTVAIAKNGTPVEETEVEEELTLAGGAEAMIVKTIVELVEDDYVEVWVKADDTVSVTLSKLSLVAVAT